VLSICKHGIFWACGKRWLPQEIIKYGLLSLLFKERKRTGVQAKLGWELQVRIMKNNYRESKLYHLSSNSLSITPLLHLRIC